MSRISDPREFGRVAVLLGGSSSEREVSLDSGAGVLAALQRRGVEAFAIDGVPALVDAIRDGGVDRVFNILHGTRGGGEDGVLQGLLDALGVPYTGTGVLGAALSMDKIRSKQVWQALGLPTPDYRVLHPGDDVAAAAASLGLPVIVKPAREGSSVGVSRVHAPDDLEQAVALAARYDGQLLMERMIEGDEFTVAILDGVALPSIRIVPAGTWYDYHAKYVADDTQYLCPGSDGEEEQRLRALALDAFNALDVTGWGRVDVMRDRQGGFWLLEVNTAPGMTSHSLVPKAAAAVGIGYDELCWRVLEGSLDRGGRA
ncbi:D-alanine--D-alanine ligase [Pseudofulvimonas gallinarii]|jgi:D-alanine-D-alanine ligase|uniref:D-alanine--D-alanine ligase n=1 Tax=Pseudofulvimonas gallinarii TaxID=634155 RepID=A0A4R3LDF3_9GAMM|nr:D-alanine--D-alanine ligase [Pseudofulvimonas gallinarii]TCS97959.1 D-alanine--D-alanine ligase [Pseudofulvimonas gallinarii]THD13114.1 D-alanine--D-alanine ligase [Pseudofulvimonas gallinarii]